MSRTARRGISPKRGPARPQSRGRREVEHFESLVEELSATMAQSPADAVDREIETWLGKICVVLDLDRSAIYERDAPGKGVRTTHTWVRPNFPPFPDNYNPEKLKSSTDWVMAGHRLVFSRPSDIPLEWDDTRRFLERYGPKASAIFPMWAGGQVIGAASFGRFRTPRQWNPQLLNQLALAVRIFSAAIERKQAEAKMRAARSELVLAQRRSMMGELVASLAHEINQPLGAILSNLGGLARLLARGNPEPAMAAKAVENAIEDTKRAGQIVRRVRAMLKGESANKVAVDIAELVKEVVRLIGSEAALRKISIQIEASASRPWVLGDGVLLQQCLLNLLMNAFDAVSELENDRRKVVLRIAPEKQGWVAVSVSDKGTGVHPSIAARVFEPFVTTKPMGMGLGLLVTRSVVENHGGEIRMEPAAAGGTTFTFTLPIAEKKRTQRSQSEKTKPMV